MSLRTLLKFNRKLLFTKLNFPKCYVHNMLEICNENLETSVGRHVKVQGWVYAIRKMKDNIFVDIMDGSTPKVLQVVIPKASKPGKLSYGSSIMAEGKLTLAPNGTIELHSNSVNVIGTCDVMDGYPFAPRKHYSDDYIRQFLHLRPRTKRFASLLRLRDITSTAIEYHLRSRGFINIHTPILTSNDCEGAGELFIVKPHSTDMLKEMRKEDITEDETYFNSKAFLTVSGQLHLEAAVRALRRVYTFGPVFRAENSKSRLHLSEFHMLEAELAFIDDIQDIMNEVEWLIKNVIIDIFEKGSSDAHAINAKEIHWLNKKFTRLTYDDAINILQNNVHCLKQPVSYGMQLPKEHELFLVKHNDNVPIFVTNWPKATKPFYMKECKDDSTKVAAMDLLVPTVGELVGGSLREDDYEKLKLKLPMTSNLSWYLELRKYGNVPTGGFGVGLERLLQCIFDVQNIKDVLPFPRWPHNCDL